MGGHRLHVAVAAVVGHRAVVVGIHPDPVLASVKVASVMLVKTVVLRRERRLHWRLRLLELELVNRTGQSVARNGLGTWRVACACVDEMEVVVVHAGQTSFSEEYAIRSPSVQKLGCRRPPLVGCAKSTLCCRSSGHTHTHHPQQNNNPHHAHTSRRKVNRARCVRLSVSEGGKMQEQGTRRPGGVSDVTPQGPTQLLAPEEKTWGEKSAKRASCVCVCACTGGLSGARLWI